MDVRSNPISLSTYSLISEVFLQLVISSKDRPYTIDSCGGSLITRETLISMSSVEFYSGIRHRPFCAQFILQTHAQEHSAKYPSTPIMVDNSIYVDDVLDSCETVKEAQKLRQQLSELVGGAGFKLRNWSSKFLSSKIYLQKIGFQV